MKVTGTCHGIMIHFDEPSFLVARRLWRRSRPSAASDPSSARTGRLNSIWRALCAVDQNNRQVGIWRASLAVKRQSKRSGWVDAESLIMIDDVDEWLD